MKKPNICGCLLNVSAEDIARYLRDSGIDLLEWRLDCFIHHRGRRQTMQALQALNTPGRHPVVATNRPARENGLFAGSEEERIQVLQEAVESGADWVDLEDDVGADHFAWFKKVDARIVVSHHDFAETPQRRRLQQLVEHMAKKGADIVKVATFAKSPQDNLRVLDLIAFGKRELAVDVIAFCMGPVGRWSRLACLLLGSPWSYAQLPGQAGAASGQLTAADLRTALELIA